MNLPASVCWQLCLTHHPLPAAGLRQGRGLPARLPGWDGDAAALTWSEHHGAARAARLSTSDSSQARGDQHHGQRAVLLDQHLGQRRPRWISTSDSARPAGLSTTDSARPRTAAEAAAVPPSTMRRGGEGAGAPARTHTHTHTYTRSLYHGTITATTPYPAVAAGGRAKRRKVTAICPTGRLANCS